DNFLMRKDRFSDEGLQEYTGPWDIGYGSARDIDPSIIVRSTPVDDKKVGQAWWAPVSFSNWNVPVSDVGWLRTTADLPDITLLLWVRAPDSGSDWYILDTHLEWKQPARPGRDNYEEPRRHLWFIICSFLVPNQAKPPMVGSKIS